MVAHSLSMVIWCWLSAKGACRSLPMRSNASSMKPTTVDTSGVNQPRVDTRPSGMAMQNRKLNSCGKQT